MNAMEDTPELFTRISMLYVNMKVSPGVGGFFPWILTMHP